MSVVLDAFKIKSNKNCRNLEIYIKSLTILLGTIAILFLSASLWVQKTFGDINIEQALWHLGNADLVALGVATDFTTRLIKFIVFFIFLFFILFLAVFLNKGSVTTNG